MRLYMKEGKQNLQFNSCYRNLTKERKHCIDCKQKNLRIQRSLDPFKRYGKVDDGDDDGVLYRHTTDKQQLIQR